MSAAIHDPFLLASYDTPKRPVKYKDANVHARNFAGLYATHHQVSGGKEGFATITAHGDGVHVLDVCSRPVRASQPAINQV